LYIDLGAVIKKKLIERILDLAGQKPLKEEKETIELKIPSWAVVAIINNDYSGLEPEDEEKLNNFLNEYKNYYFVPPEGEEYFSHHNDIDGNLGGNVYDMQAIPNEDKTDEDNPEEKELKPAADILIKKWGTDDVRKINIYEMLEKEFPTQKINNLKITKRDDGSKSFRVDINGETSYMSTMPEKVRKFAYQILNTK
jgi:hypothetical protein